MDILAEDEYGKFLRDYAIKLRVPSNRLPLFTNFRLRIPADDFAPAAKRSSDHRGALQFPARRPNRSFGPQASKGDARQLRSITATHKAL